MEQKYFTEPGFHQTRAGRLFHPAETPAVAFPIQSVVIDWDRLLTMRPLVLKTIDAMPPYLLKPEVLQLLDAEKHPTYRLIIDLMWTTGGRISEVLALTPSSFINNGYDFNVILKMLKQHPGRPTNASLQRSPKRCVPIKDYSLQDRIQSYLYAGGFKPTQRIFSMTRQTVNRHIHTLVDRAGAGRAPFSISCHTFRHSFAIHLLLHGCPLKIIAEYLGHNSTHNTEIYNNVLTINGGHFLDGVDFH